MSHRIIVPGTIVPNADRIAQVSVKLSGTIMELRKKVGDTVAKGEVIAALESRDLAAAKSEYLAARLNSDLQKNLMRATRTCGSGGYSRTANAEVRKRRGAR